MIELPSECTLLDDVTNNGRRLVMIRHTRTRRNFAVHAPASAEESVLSRRLLALVASVVRLLG